MMALLMDNYLTEKFGDKLKELRRKKGWAQEDAAREIGVSLSTVQVFAALRGAKYNDDRQIASDKLGDIFVARR